MKPLDYTKDFEEFWSRYPKRWNRNLSCYVKRKKWPAFQKWQKLNKDIRKRCLAIVHMIKDSEGTPRDCVTWLNERGWEDIESEPRGRGLPKEMIENLFKIVPEGDNRSTSDKVNEQRTILERNRK